MKGSGQKDTWDIKEEKESWGSGYQGKTRIATGGEIEEKHKNV